MSGSAEGHVTPWGSASVGPPLLAWKELIAFLKSWLHLLTQRSLATRHSFGSKYYTLQLTLPVASNEPASKFFLLSLDELITDVPATNQLPATISPVISGRRLRL